ncbi:PrgH/EprH family type III secretion apparatus protein [Stenotrophomonas tumulicola]|uniref:PrgH/EprH family type III secretion apparatus protein n=1 Tax=Stenotrophomonas tumulicola TaxID=1685415 RepID=A0A7W3IIC4_9GAMM|nr:PrgH/EprH family type III secretion apparatus protein [Stenotrophomonas tumulicola]MBA8682071.1 hypothetical protein [Stenotrophomonas tumulicola]
MSYLLKILSGTLAGVEYALGDGDTVFHVGPHRELIDGVASQVFGATENVYYLPEELPPAAFLVRVDADATTAGLRLGERTGADTAWHYRALELQQVMQSAGVHFAVRQRDDAWSAEVVSFILPPASPEHGETSGPIRVAAVPGLPVQRPRLLLGLAVLACIALAAGWMYWNFQPDARVRGLAAVLRDAPGEYQVVAGEDNRLYVFVDDAAGKAWGERASRRLQRGDDIYLVRYVEATRLERLLIDAGQNVVVVRLQPPRQPQIVLAGVATSERRKRVQQILSGQTPYAPQLEISAISDQALTALAQAQLRRLGISSRAEPRGQRVSIVNDVFLDDAGLNAMARTASEFHRHWGRHRISIQLQLWDDLLQGRSYQYSPGQLLSVGNGRWQYSRAAGTDAGASP